MSLTTLISRIGSTVFKTNHPLIKQFIGIIYLFPKQKRPIIKSVFFAKGANYMNELQIFRSVLWESNPNKRTTRTDINRTLHSVKRLKEY